MKIPLNTELDINMADVTNIVASRLAKEIQKSLKTAYGDRYSFEFKEIVADSVASFLEENKEHIIDETIKSLTQRLANTKAVKEKLKIVLDEYGVQK